MSLGETRPRRASGRRRTCIVVVALSWAGSACGEQSTDTSASVSSTGAGGSTAAPSSSASSGAGGAHGTGWGDGGVGPAICPPGSDMLKLSLAGANPVPVAGVPPADGYGQGFSIIEGLLWIDGALYLTQITATKSPPPA